jgi:hypothetical protein
VNVIGPQLLEYHYVAYDDSPINQNIFRPRIDFATDLNNRVIRKTNSQGLGYLGERARCARIRRCCWEGAGAPVEEASNTQDPLHYIE